MGKQAIAVLAAGQDPGKLDLATYPDKVLAFDNDEAGHQLARNGARSIRKPILLSDAWKRHAQH